MYYFNNGALYTKDKQDELAAMLESEGIQVEEVTDDGVGILCDGDIKNGLRKIVQDFASKGILLNGHINFTGSLDGQYFIENGVLTVLSRGEVALREVPVTILLKELERREQTTTNLISQVEKLHNNTPDGVIIDADTILADLVQNNDEWFAQDIFNIWETSTDKRSVEQMFFEFVGVEFNEYLRRCIDGISRTE